MTERLYHCNSEIKAQLNYVIKIYLYMIILSFKRPRSLKAAGLLVLTVQCSVLCSV